uniref:sodium-dependent phosphate transport protein 2B-like isoform X2 n=2 Tax=Callithrix jacchus TaxID=9483 RepID=UPI0023DD3B6C|nr:sodium-dependent phosphate transport protein 2B-like isoform X2 [Callithrix jacchus]XP_035156983.2 sodium-dependent phosphate transport protein 2B-like isoform X2 [Callithrix jacchus]XP_035156994.2 sodium-dependent phosphate transport protein 2B-like isoform X2 [Callithrix jacchus]
MHSCHLNSGTHSPPERRSSFCIRLALCHFFFNISGILLWYPIPFTRLPIRMAKGLGNISAKYRWFTVFYLIVFFFLIPLTVFGLSLAGWPVLVGVGVPVLLIVILVLCLRLLQSRCPRILPKILQNWHCLPLWMRSLKPWDAVVSKLAGCFQLRCCCCCRLCCLLCGCKCCRCSRWALISCHLHACKAPDFSQGGKICSQLDCPVK